MYADDLTIYASAFTDNELNRVLNVTLALQAVVKWITNNKLVLNVSKTNSIIFGSNHTLSRNPVLKLDINNVYIRQVHENKLLGIILDSKLAWTKQINNIVAKMGRGISVIKRCAKFLTQKSIKQVIQAVILSHLDYCPVVWSSVSKDKIKKLQMVQNRAVRIMLRCGYRTNVAEMHNCLAWLHVKNRLLYSLLVFIRNISVTKTHLILFKNLSFSLDRHGYSTRHATGGNFILPKARTNAIKRTVMYRAMFEWNLLQRNVTQENGKIRFKMLLKKHLLTRDLGQM